MREQIDKFFKKKIPYYALDIGSTSVKFLELDPESAKPKVLRYGIFPLQGEIFSGHVLSHGQKVSDVLTKGLTDFDSTDKRAVTAVPGPSVFTKRIKVPKMAPQELASHIELEAGNFLPQNLSSVKIDYHTLGESGKNQLEVLVVAAKGDIVESFADCLNMAGFTPGIVDVDYFAVENSFEANYPELLDKNVVLIHIGARYAAVNICKNGSTLFTGDVSVGGKQLTEGLMGVLSCSAEDAEKLKRSGWAGHTEVEMISLCVREYVTNAAAELHRQLSFFWNATGSDEGIDAIVLSGGGALTPGLKEALEERTEIPTSFLDPFKVVDISDAECLSGKLDKNTIFSVAGGLSLRRHKDKGNI